MSPPSRALSLGGAHRGLPALHLGAAPRADPSSIPSACSAPGFARVAPPRARCSALAPPAPTFLQSAAGSTTSFCLSASCPRRLQAITICTTLDGVDVAELIQLRAIRRIGGEESAHAGAETRIPRASRTANTAAPCSRPCPLCVSVNDAEVTLEKRRALRMHLKCLSCGLASAVASAEV